MSREVCGICWCPYDEDTGECACKVPSDCTDSHQPVAWRWGYRSITTGEMDWRGYVEIPAHPNLRSPAIIMEPLYAAPPQRKPLTIERLRDALVASRIIPPAAVEDPDEYDDGVTLLRIDALHRRIT